MGNPISKKTKAILIAFGAVVAALLIAFFALVLTAPSRVEGRWQCDVGFLESYGCYGTNTFTFNDDGSYVHILTQTGTDNVLKISIGTWEMSMFSVECRSSDHGPNNSTPFNFNPFTNHMINGGWDEDEGSGNLVFYKVG